jgi:hypothetical protein
MSSWKHRALLTPELDPDGFIAAIGGLADSSKGCSSVRSSAYDRRGDHSDLRPVRAMPGSAHRTGSNWLVAYAARRLVVVVAVAQRRLGPSSSATTSTAERALPSSAVQLRCWSRPRTTTRLPLASDSAACSAWSRHTITVKNDASCSLRPDTATRKMARAIPQRTRGS